MNQTEAPAPSRASEIWRRFVGMFGGDSVERKYGRAPPPEWVSMVGRLKDFEIDRGVRRLVYSGAKGVPSLPEFVSLCRKLGDDIEEGRRPPALPSTDGGTYDRWDIRANFQFLAYMRGLLARHPRIWGAPQSPEQAKCVAIAVAYKNAWARDMREWCGEPTRDEQRTCWEQCVLLAERDIAAVMQGPKA